MSELKALRMDLERDLRDCKSVIDRVRINLVPVYLTLMHTCLNIKYQVLFGFSLLKLLCKAMAIIRRWCHGSLRKILTLSVGNLKFDMLLEKIGELGAIFIDRCLFVKDCYLLRLLFYTLVMLLCTWSYFLVHVYRWSMNCAWAMRSVAPSMRRSLN